MNLLESKCANWKKIELYFQSLSISIVSENDSYIKCEQYNIIYRTHFFILVYHASLYCNGVLLFSLMILFIIVQI
jgi:hypothetical protein